MVDFNTVLSSDKTLTEAVELIFSDYIFRIKFLIDGHLPTYKGSTFRGAFGHALKSVICALRNQECVSCLLKNNCAFNHLFATDEAQGRMSKPKPYVLVPPLDEQSFFQAGSEASFSLRLFGDTAQYAPYFVYSFIELGKKGIGRRESGSRGIFELVSVSSQEQILYSNDNPLKFEAAPKRTLAIDSKKTGSFEDIGSAMANSKIGSVVCDVCSNVRSCIDSTHVRWDDVRSGISDVSDLTLRTYTPLRIKHGNGFQSRDLPFHVLIRALLRRISSVFEVYGTGEPLIDYRELVRQSEQIVIRSSTLSWHDWERYSARQMSRMSFGGLVGSVVYEGELAPFIPLLHLGELLHIGKQTTFGLGKYSVHYLGNAGVRF